MPKYLTLKEASAKMGITTQSLSEWLNRHIEIKTKYCDVTTSGKRRVYLQEEALTVIATVKDGFRGSKSKKGNPNVKHGKQMVAEVAVAAIEARPENILLQVAKILNGLEKRVLVLEGRNEKPDVKSLPVQKTSLPQSQDALRTLLNMRIKSYAQHTGAEYKDLWNLLYATFLKRTGVNLKEKAIERGIETLDVAQRCGYIFDLFRIASELYRIPQSLNR